MLFVGCAHAAGSIANNPAPEPQLFIQVQGFADQLESEPGRSLRAVLSGLGVFDRTAETWLALGESLGLTGDEAVTALLSGRFTFLADGLDSDQPVWACVMSIDPAIGARIPKVFKAAPRGSLDGRTVYAIEDGRLSVMPIGTDGRVLAISSQGGDKLLTACAQIASTWRDHADLTAEPGAIVMYKPVPGAMLSGTLSLRPGGWDFEFVTQGGVLGTPGETTPQSAVGIDEEWYTRVSADASIAYAGPVGARAKARDGTRWRLDEVPRLIRAFMPYAPPKAFMEGGSDFGVFLNRGNGSGSMWFRVHDARRAAQLGDAHICDLLGNLPGSGLVSGDSPECTGRFPDAGRRLAIPVRSQASDERIGLAWGIQPGAEMGDPSGVWWSMHSVTARSAGAMGEEVPRFNAQNADTFMRFTIRPALFPDHLELGKPQAAVEAGGPIASISRVTMLDCSLSHVVNGGASGWVRLRLAGSGENQPQPTGAPPSDP